MSAIPYTTDEFWTDKLLETCGVASLPPGNARIELVAQSILVILLRLFLEALISADCGFSELFSAGNWPCSKIPEIYHFFELRDVQRLLKKYVKKKLERTAHEKSHQ